MSKYHSDWLIISLTKTFKRVRTYLKTSSLTFKERSKTKVTQRYHIIINSQHNCFLWYVDGWYIVVLVSSAWNWKNSGLIDDCVLWDCRLLYSYFLFFDALPSKLLILYNYLFTKPSLVTNCTHGALFARCRNHEWEEGIGFLTQLCFVQTWRLCDQSLAEIHAVQNPYLSEFLMQ